jgi:uncharacterized protein
MPSYKAWYFAFRVSVLRQFLGLFLFDYHISDCNNLTQSALRGLFSVGRIAKFMEMSGEYRIAAPIGDVWAALNDVEVLKRCIPGCEELEQVSDTEMTAKVALKIGPVKARFKGVVNFENVNAPNGYSIVGEGQGGIAGFAKGGADVQLVEDGGETILTYQAQAQVGGKIAQLGSRLIKSTAAKLADKFFKNFHDVLSGAETAA